MLAALLLVATVRKGEERSEAVASV